MCSLVCARPSDSPRDYRLSETMFYGSISSNKYFLWVTHEKGGRKQHTVFMLFARLAYVYG